LGIFCGSFSLAKNKLCYTKMMKNPFDILELNALNFKLTPISFREIFFIAESPCDIYGLVDGLFKVVIFKKAEITNFLLRELLQNNLANLFVLEEDRDKLRAAQQENLINVTRSLSIGDPLEKARAQANLLTINLGYLYEDPANDKLLTLQVQSVRNLAIFLYGKPQIHEALYKDFIKQGHHYIFAQPFLSTLFLLGVMKNSRFYTDKDVELFALTSYFKDIGMSAIPVEKYNQENLEDDDRKLLASHPQHSVNILKNRVPLPPNFLKVIENHHIYSTLTNQYNLADKDDPSIVFGFETMMISVMDTVAAMITDRPFRKAESLYRSLDLIRLLIGEQYPQEFKLIVFYFKNFFKQAQ
jgi:HD-GYP domain-containing protein (c-di-GMP phosphodiesterase class II)